MDQIQPSTPKRAKKKEKHDKTRSHCSRGSTPERFQFCSLLKTLSTNVIFHSSEGAELFHFLDVKWRAGQILKGETLKLWKSNVSQHDFLLNRNLNNYSCSKAGTAAAGELLLPLNWVTVTEKRKIFELLTHCSAILDRFGLGFNAKYIVKLYFPPLLKRIIIFLLTHNICTIQSIISNLAASTVSEKLFLFLHIYILGITWILTVEKTHSFCSYSDFSVMCEIIKLHKVCIFSINSLFTYCTQAN